MARILALSNYLATIDPSYIEKLDQASIFPEEIFKEFHRIGIMTCALPKELGGDGVPMEELIHMAAEISQVSPGLFSSWIGNLLGVTAIAEFAEPGLKNRVLQEYGEGKQLMSFCFTEPEAGTDLNALVTTFEKNSDGYIINGHKHLITNVTVADHYIVFARPVDKGNPEQHPSAFYISKNTPGITLGEPFKKMGHRESNTGRIAFKNVKVSSKNLLGQSGKGADVISRCISRTKTLIGAASIGLCRKAHNLTLESLTNRVLYGSALIKRADIRAQLADLNTRVEAGWLLTLNAGKAWDNGNAVKEASMAKYYCSMTAVDFVSKAMELCGALSYMQEHPISKMYRDAKLFEIYEGASLVQLSIIAREVLRIPKSSIATKKGGLMIKTSDMQLVLMPARFPEPEYYDYYNKAYALWKEVWGGVWSELGRPTASDSFIRQDEVCAIFHKDECIALTLQYVANFNLPSHREDSYFSRVWLTENLNLLDPYLPNICCGNHITTNPKYRQKAFGFSLKDVLLGECVNCFIDHKECNVMVGSMRKNRGVTDLALRFGAKQVYSYFAQDYKFDLDLVLFDRKLVHECTDLVARKIIKELWDKRIDVRARRPQFNKSAA